MALSESRRILVFGRDGQVASAFRKVFPSAAFIPSSECNFENLQTVDRVLKEYRPSIVVNPAAYTQVDKAESDVDRASAVNSRAPRLIADWCASNNSSLIHFSTDYVYTGDGDQAWSESDLTGPRNIYGQTKLKGENAVRESGCHHLILRTSWVYSSVGKNFVLTMVRLAQERENLKVVSDQVGAPTFAEDLAHLTGSMIQNKRFQEISGVFNIANSGTTTWYEFANVIFSKLRSKGIELKVRIVEPIASSDYPTPAARPLNSRLDLSKLASQFGLVPRLWDLALDDCLKQIVGR